MEAYSDGVFAIAATLLVLEIAVHPPGTALEQLGHEWPAYLGYGISFLTIGAEISPSRLRSDQFAKTMRARIVSADD
jgi:hypothetical protein